MALVVAESNRVEVGGASHVTLIKRLEHLAEKGCLTEKDGFMSSAPQASSNLNGGLYGLYCCISAAVILERYKAN